MPALGHTVEEATIAADSRVMHPGEFRRAYGNQWPDESDQGWSVIPRDVWMAAAAMTPGMGATASGDPPRHVAVRSRIAVLPVWPADPAWQPLDFDHRDDGVGYRGCPCAVQPASRWTVRAGHASSPKKGIDANAHGLARSGSRSPKRATTRRSARPGISTGTSFFLVDLVTYVDGTDPVSDVLRLFASE